MSIVQNQYNQISSMYEVFYSGVNKEEIYNSFIETHKKYFNKLTDSSIVCDCSCGNGLQAIAMKKIGLNIIASDISEEMVNMTKTNAKIEGIELQVYRKAWKELPIDYSNHFDLVFCWGNSISHSLSKEEMNNNLKSMYSILKNNGKLIIETRNWDKIIKDKQRYYSYTEKNYNGRKILPIYVMNVDDFDKECNLEMIFIESLNDGTTKCEGYTLNFMPFKHTEFLERLSSVGFSIIEDTYNETEDFYSVVVEK